MKLAIKILALLILGLTASFPQAGYTHPQPKTLDSDVVLPPSWAFGVLYGAYTNQEQSIERINNIINHDYPIDAYWIDSWFWSFDDKGVGPHKYIDFVADTVAFPDRKSMWDFMQQKNIKAGFWIWDRIFETGNEQIFNEFKVRGFFKNLYYETNSWHNGNSSTAMFQQGSGKKGTLCGDIDFNNSAAVDYFEKNIQHFFDEGADFLKLDRTTAIEVCKSVFETSQKFGKETKGRGFMMSHMHGTENPEFKKYPIKWTSDTRADWTIEAPTKNFNSWVPKVALKENIALFTDKNSQTAKIPFLTNDLGGFDIGTIYDVDEELYIRWLQFSQFLPVVESFSQPENATSNLAYNYSLRADTLFRFYSHLRMELFPYVYTYAHRARLFSEPMVKANKGDYHSWLFGNELLVAPVYVKGAQSREVLLPEGEWIDFWTDKTLQGNTTIKATAPIETIPLYVRKGSVIPFRKYARSIESGTNDTLTLHWFPGKNSSFDMIEDDGTSNDYLNGIYAVTKIDAVAEKVAGNITIHPTKGYYNGMNLSRVVRLAIHTSAKGVNVEIDTDRVTCLNSNGIFFSPYYKIANNKGGKFSINFLYEQ